MKYGFIGCGNMGGAIAKALSKSTTDIALSDRSGKGKVLAQQLGVTYSDNDAIAATSIPAKMRLQIPCFINKSPFGCFVNNLFLCYQYNIESLKNQPPSLGIGLSKVVYSCFLCTCCKCLSASGPQKMAKGPAEIGRPFFDCL